TGPREDNEIVLHGVRCFEARAVRSLVEHPDADEFAFINRFLVVAHKPFQILISFVWLIIESVR
ncbi:MAG TPA: hypothetical protein VE136_03125, partial [Anaerolineales bacterium]|nr:hypothetical protein [Anaerolineales bacterium]